jgi:hypothetical protein
VIFDFISHNGQRYEPPIRASLQANLFCCTYLTSFFGYSKTPIYRHPWEHGKGGGKSGFSIPEPKILPKWPENTV